MQVLYNPQCQEVTNLTSEIGLFTREWTSRLSRLSHNVILDYAVMNNWSTTCENISSMSFTKVFSSTMLRDNELVRGPIVVSKQSGSEVRAEMACLSCVIGSWFLVSGGGGTDMSGRPFCRQQKLIIITWLIMQSREEYRADDGHRTQIMIQDIFDTITCNIHSIWHLD